jgi:thiol-disulfide isomerase/thioredoxin
VYAPGIETTPGSWRIAGEIAGNYLTARIVYNAGANLQSAKAVRNTATTTAASSHKRNPVVTWIGLAVLALLLIAYLVWGPRRTDRYGVRHPVVGTPLVFLELSPLTGDAEPITLADLKGKVTLVNVWGTWCSACAEEFPYLAAIHGRLKDRRDFRYLSISYNDVPLDELRFATEEFLRQQRADHATYRDPGMQTLQALYMIGIEDSFPLTLVLDRNATVRGVWPGYNRSSIAEIDGLLNELLKE